MIADPLKALLVCSMSSNLVYHIRAKIFCLHGAEALRNRSQKLVTRGHDDSKWRKLCGWLDYARSN